MPGQDAGRGRAGRTVLFVSHNMAAVKSLTHRALVINAGQLVFSGQTDQAIEKYGALTARGIGLKSLGRGKHTSIRAVRLLDQRGSADKPLRIRGADLIGSKSRSKPMELEGCLAMCWFWIKRRPRSRSPRSRISKARRFLPKKASIVSLMPLAAIEPRPRASTRSMSQRRSSIRCGTTMFMTRCRSMFNSPIPRGLTWNFCQSFGYGVVALPFESEATFERVDALEVAS